VNTTQTVMAGAVWVRLGWLRTANCGGALCPAPLPPGARPRPPNHEAPYPGRSSGHLLTQAEKGTLSAAGNHLYVLAPTDDRPSGGFAQSIWGTKLDQAQRQLKRRCGSSPGHLINLPLWSTLVLETDAS
jgi:hypothetical protein